MTTRNINLRPKIPLVAGRFLSILSPITKLPIPNSPDDSLPNLIYGLWKERGGKASRPNLSISITRDALTLLAALFARNEIAHFIPRRRARRARKYRLKAGKKGIEGIIS